MGHKLTPFSLNVFGLIQLRKYHLLYFMAKEYTKVADEKITNSNSGRLKFVITLSMTIFKWAWPRIIINQTNEISFSKFKCKWTAITRGSIVY